MGLLRPPHPAGRGGGRFLNWPIPAALAHLGESCFTSQRDAAPALTKSPVLLDLGKEENRKENEKRKRKKRNLRWSRQLLKAQPRAACSASTAATAPSG